RHKGNCPFLWLTLVFLEEQRSVGSAETKRIRQCVPNISPASLVRHVIEIALGIWNFVINGRRNCSALDDKRRNSRFDGAGSAQKVADHGFRRTDRHLPR